jgi:hypothetical protein
MNIRPVDLPFLCGEVAIFLESEGEAISRGRDLNNEVAMLRDLFGGRSDERIVVSISTAELRAMVDGQLFWVSAEMAQLAAAAAQSLPGFTLAPEDVPSESGFLYFQSPPDAVFGDEEGWEEQGSPRVVGAAWGPVKDVRTSGLWVTWYTDRDSTLDEYLRLGLTEPRDVESTRARSPRILPHRPLFLPFVESSIELAEIEGLPERHPFGFSSDVLKTAWLLMQQPVAAVSDAVYDRNTRRRLEREGKESPPVRVITLRRPANPGGSGESVREYHHQWIVRGHWRQQWYSSRGVNRPVWIAPHVKGPEGAPMLGGQKVYAWTR